MPLAIFRATFHEHNVLVSLSLCSCPPWWWPATSICGCGAYCQAAVHLNAAPGECGTGLQEDDSKWPEPDRTGRQELEVIMGGEHISFATTKLGSMLEVRLARPFWLQQSEAALAEVPLPMRRPSLHCTSRRLKPSLAAGFVNKLAM